MIEANGLVKRYGTTTAVNGLGFTAKPGQVTGFLGPNGSGKSTTMRMILGLDEPNEGSVTVNGTPYRNMRAPLSEVGALLEARAVHTGRSARNHLLAMAATAGIGRRRVEEVIELTGLGSVANRRAGGFSLGMGQRLGIAGALLGDPHTLVLDEPINGLDPEGVAWVRRLVRHLASEGRTVFLSSHLMSEMALTADEIVIVGKGRLIAQASIDEVLAMTASSVLVATPDATVLAELLTERGATVTTTEPSSLRVTGATAQEIGELAAAHRLVLHQLATSSGSLEEAYFTLTSEAVEYRSGLEPSELAGTAAPATATMPSQKGPLS